MTLWVTALTAGVVLGAPLAYAALGELVAERAGVINLGVEGMMLMGAVAGFVVTFNTGNPAYGVAAAAAAGSSLALLHAFMTITLRVNQIVMGLTLTILGSGLSAYIGAGYAGRKPGGTFAPIAIPVLSSIPGLGKIFFDHDVLVYGAAGIAVAIWLFLYRSRWGLWLRSAGEQPAAADSTGVPVFWIRYLAVVFGGALAGVAGAYFSIVYTRGWAEGMTAGRGWIAIALVIFASWDPLAVLLGALLFGFIDSLNFQLQNAGVPISSEVLAMMPYVFTLLVLVVAWSRMRRGHWGMPAAVGLPYEREAR